MNGDKPKPLERLNIIRQDGREYSYGFTDIEKLEVFEALALQKGWKVKRIASKA